MAKFLTAKVARWMTQEDIIRLNHYTNLQPLESYYNRHIKRNNYVK